MTTAKTAQLAQVAFERGALCYPTHVALKNGHHSSGFFNCQPLMEAQEDQQLFGRALALELLAYNVDLMVGPLSEGGLWCDATARQYEMLTGQRLLFTYARTKSRYENGQPIYEGQVQIFDDEDEKLQSGMRVAIVNDVLSTGLTVASVIQAVLERGAIPVVLLVICDSHVNDLDLGIPIVSQLRYAWPVWTEKECPIQEIPLETNGRLLGKTKLGVLR